MRRWEIERFSLDGLRQVEAEAPRPGPGQVRLRLRAWSLNYRDLMIVRGEYNPRQKLPLVPLSDGVGEVVELGPGAGRFAVGDRVAGTFIQAWLDGPLTLEARASALGSPLPGVLAEEVVLPESGLVAVPGHLTDEGAACLPCAGVTAYNALFEQAALRPGQTVLLLGTGGVSIFALQLARLAGARVAVVSGSQAKLERGRALGAEFGVCRTEEPEWERAVRRWAGGDGVDCAVEVGGADTLPRVLAALRPEGTAALIGVLSGAQVELPLAAVFMKQLRLRGVFVGSRRMFEGLNRAVAASGLQPVVDRAFGFGEFPAALRYLESGAHFGKVVLKP